MEHFTACHHERNSKRDFIAKLLLCPLGHVLMKPDRMLNHDTYCLVCLLHYTLTARLPIHIIPTAVSHETHLE